MALSPSLLKIWFLQLNHLLAAKVWQSHVFLCAFAPLRAPKKTPHFPIRKNELSCEEIKAKL
jgi:hypothetical protein